MLRQRLNLRRDHAVPRKVAGGIMPAVVGHSMAGGTPALRGILGGPAPFQDLPQRRRHAEGKRKAEILPANGANGRECLEG